ncbi:NAD-dependent epimerase/dehydratase family protein [Actinomadura monticuli]|uniref:NAD-dependent epimerase/dehydratase family protein n=1 Tax=Actinomadura monticuli TaxID=3097367 RepID=A0ABV4QLG6_9ACTN
MRLLVVGGSWFVGREIVSAAIHRNAEVTVFNRGRSGPVPSGVNFVQGDWENHADLLRLAENGPWDAVLDVAGSVPAIVRDVARALAPVTRRYVFISTISAYRDWPYEPVDEASPLWDGDPDYEPGTRRWDPDAYGPLKVGCEKAIRREFGDDVLTIRPHVVLGPREYVGRLPWWLGRIARGGRVLAPAPADRGFQPVDVRDLAEFTVDRAMRGDAGVFNVAAPVGRDTYGDFLDACAEVTGSSAEFVWADEQWLVKRGVTEWTELPLWRALPTAWSMDTGRAQAAGLRTRPLLETVCDTWAWLQAGGRPIDHERFAEHGIDPEREERLLAEWDRVSSRAPGS